MINKTINMKKRLKWFKFRNHITRKIRILFIEESKSKEEAVSLTRVVSHEEVNLNNVKTEIPEITYDSEKNEMIQFVCETYRYLHAMMKLSKLGDGFGRGEKRFNSATIRLNKKLEKIKDFLQIEFVEFVGQIYDTGLPVDVLNFDEFEKEDLLVIEETLEPTIKKKGSSIILKTGKVIVNKKA